MEEEGTALVSPHTGEGRILAVGIVLEGELDDPEMVEIFGASPEVDSDDAKIREDMVMAANHPRTGGILWRGRGSAQGQRPEEGAPERSGVIRDAVRSVMEVRRTPLEL